MAFHVGQKVVCVDATPAPFPGPPNGLIKDRIYTVAEIGLINLWDPNRLPCISLEGTFDRSGKILNPMWAHRFRPVVERKTDISVFTEMLTPKKVNEKV